MKEAAEHVTDVLNEASITASVTGGVYWELAEEDTEIPFATFSLSDTGFASKNIMMQYQVKLRVFAKNLTEASNHGKVIRTAVKAGNNTWRDRGASIGYTDAEAKEAYIELTYEFKF